MQYKITTATIGIGLLLAVPGTALAQPHGGGTMGGSWGLFGGWLWPLLLVGLVALLIYGLFGAVGSGDGGRANRGGRTDRALEELRERYARGELSREEFDERRRTLER